MGENTGGERGVLGRARGFVAGRPATQKVGGGVAAALLASAPFGGLAGTPEPPPEPLRLDQPIMVGPYKVVINQVVEIPDLAPAVKPKPPERLILLDAEVTLTGDRPEYAVTLTKNLHLTGGDVKVSKQPELYFVEDATRPSVFNPDITYRLAITWTTSDKWRGETATVSANLVEFREEDRLTLDPNAWVSRDKIQYESVLPVVRKS